MRESYGPGVTRVINPDWRQIVAVPFLDGMPVADSDLALLAQVAQETFRQAGTVWCPSGFLIDPTQDNDYGTDPSYSNCFTLGKLRGQAIPLWGIVHGWFVPVAGVRARPEFLTNWVRLNPPPESGGRVDLVFLEVWKALVEGTPSEVNKPGPDLMWTGGNTQHPGPYLPDEIENPQYGINTTRRVQIQYRFRVHGKGSGRGAGVALDVYPDGLGDPNLLGQGAGPRPVAGYPYQSQADQGDPGLYRAGDGDPNNPLGSVDGYSYAIPICAVFRRNSAPYAAVVSAGNPNQGGGTDRNPQARLLPDPSVGALPLSPVSLRDPVGPDFTAGLVLRAEGLVGSALLQAKFVWIGQEVFEISNLDPAGGTFQVVSRGRYGTAPVGHPAGTPVELFSTRPDRVYADQIRPEDILDLRHAVTPGDWDYGRLLESSLGQLLQGKLRSTWKRSGPGDVEGPVVHEVDYLQIDPAVKPAHTDQLDGPDGIRTIWSDAATPQYDVTLLLDNEATTNQNAVGLSTADQFDTTTRWDLGADFKPTGFLNVGDSGLKAFTNGSCIFLHLGGETGQEGAKGTFREAGTEAVRFISPAEAWRSDGDPAQVGQQETVTVRFLGMRAYEPPPIGPGRDRAHPGPMAPSRPSGFERPFIFLGGIAHPSLRVPIPTANLYRVGGQYEVDLGINFDLSGVYYSTDQYGAIENDPSRITRPLVRNERTLFGMLSQNGTDLTGNGSELYLVLYGDPKSLQNNGAFRVIGAGTKIPMLKTASGPTRLVVVPLSTDFDPRGFDSGSGQALMGELRSQICNSDDSGSYRNRIGDAAIVFTDLGGIAIDHRWDRDSLRGDAPQVDPKLGRVAVERKLFLNLTLLYHPGRGGTARVADQIVRFALRSGTGRDVGGYLAQDPTQLDPTFGSAAGIQSGEISFRASQLATWNRLTGLGLPAPIAPAYGGGMRGGTVERETELFVDLGSKTILFRPLRRREATLFSIPYRDQIPTNRCLLGPYTYPNGVPKDGLQIWTGTPISGKLAGVPVPPEVMPRFGRLDIPYYRDLENGRGPFLTGLNHLFVDVPDPSDPTFAILGGGQDNTSGGVEATLMHFSTGGAQYGTSATIIGTVNPLPNIGARKTTRIDPNTPYAKDILDRLRRVASPEGGNGLRGIQLPPLYGIARLLGVYERQDFIKKAGRTFRRDRIRIEDDPARNLIREDARIQTLFLFQDGAQDFTGEEGDHTYIIPDGILDLTRIPGYVPGRTFDDYDYVVVTTIFGFAHGWITQNNLVLLRNHDGAGRAQTDLVGKELEGVKMCVPAPAAHGDHLFCAYDRTPYQGDPYGTRGGTSRVTGDYQHRLGEIPPQLQKAGSEPIQQQDEAGNFIPQVPNPRGFQVLSVMDFYTTLGTGKIGGQLYRCTVTDCGHTEESDAAAQRNPPDPDRAWRVETSCFTLGQSASTVRAVASVEVLDNDSFQNAIQHGLVYVLIFKGPEGAPQGIYLTTREYAPVVRINLFAAPYDLAIVDETGRTEDILEVISGVDFGILSPEPGRLSSPEVVLDPSRVPALKNLPPEQIPVQVEVTFPDSVTTPYGGVVVVTGRRDGANLVLRAHYLAGVQGINMFGAKFVQTVEIEFGEVRPLASLYIRIPWAGIDPIHKSIGIVVPERPLPPGTSVEAHVFAPGQIQVTMTNNTTGPIIFPKMNYQIAMVENLDLDEWRIDLTRQDCTCRVSWERGARERTCQELVRTIEQHPVVRKLVKARWDGGARVELEAEQTGQLGGQTFVEARLIRAESLVSTAPYGSPDQVLGIQGGRPGYSPLRYTSTGMWFRGGYDIPTGAGPGLTQIGLTGMTERLPLGLLVQDSDFLGESPLRDETSAFRGGRSQLSSIQQLLPLAQGGVEYTRSLGVPGEQVGAGDGAVLTYTPYTTTTPTGSRVFRTYRGGSLFMLSGARPGGPVEWSSGSWPPGVQPVLRGGVLICRAYLIRTFKEEAFGPIPYVTNQGDEIQMVIGTFAKLGNGQSVQAGVDLSGQVGPSGYGEGFAAVDRFRIPAHPLYRGGSNQVPDRDPREVEPAPYSEE